MLPRLRKDKELSSSIVTLSTQSEQMMIASKPGYQLHAQLIPFQGFANNGRWRCKWHVDEDQGVDDFLHDIEDSDNGYEDKAIICCRHTYRCMYIYYIQLAQQ